MRTDQRQDFVSVTAGKVLVEPPELMLFPAAEPFHVRVDVEGLGQ